MSNDTLSLLGPRPQHFEPYSGFSDDIVGYFYEPTGNTRRRWSWWKLRWIDEKEVEVWVTVDYLANVRIRECDLHDYREGIKWVRS